MPATTPSSATELPAHAPAPNWAVHAAIAIVEASRAFSTDDELAWAIAQQLEIARQIGVVAGLDVARRAQQRGDIQ